MYVDLKKLNINFSIGTVHMTKILINCNIKTPDQLMCVCIKDDSLDNIDQLLHLHTNLLCLLL